MEILDTAVTALVIAIAAIAVPSERIFLLYAISSVGIVFLLYLYRKPTVAFLRYCFPKEVLFHRSAKQDYLFYFLLALCKGVLVVAPLAWLGSSFHDWWIAPVELQTGESSVQGLGSMIAFSFLLLIAFDFGIFLSHYLQHRVPILWEFHKVHHSAEVLTPITVFRMSPIDLLVTGATVIVFETAVRALWLFFVGPAPDILTILGLNGGIFLFYLFGYNLRHSHIWLSYPAWLSGHLVSPAMHQIHHSSEVRHWDKNMGLVFSWWDWLFGTLYIPKEKETFAYGINGAEANPFHATHEMLWKPFVWAWRRISNRAKQFISLFSACLTCLIGLTQDTAAKEIYTPPSLHLEELTWTEVKRAIGSGYDQVIVPSGGTEQNGPHMVLGKHNIVVRHTSEELAQELGNTLVAPVLSYVPEGDINPPTGHMRFPGTITIGEQTYRDVLVSTAESLLQHGFTSIYLIGDSGSTQSSQQSAADQVNGGWWWSDPPKVFHIGDYYSPETNGQIAALEGDGYSREQIGTHAGIRDTSEVLALRAVGIRSDTDVVPGALMPGQDTGVVGNPALASVEIGRAMLNLKVQAALTQIRSLQK